MPTLSSLEWGILSEKVQSVASQYQLADFSSAFLYLVLDQFFPDRSADFPEMVVDGGNDLGIDAIEIFEKDERADIYLFQSKYRTSLKSTERTINDAEVLKINTFLKALFDQSDLLLKSGNIQIREAVARIWDLHRRGILCQYRIIFCTNGNGLSVSAENLLRDTFPSPVCIEYEIYGPQQIIRDVGLLRKDKEQGKLQVLNKEIIERVDGDVKGIIASVSAISFIDLIRTADGKSLKRHLFDDNLRIFLGANGGYNTNIIRTASSDESHLFWYLNNGITITCADYHYNKSHFNPIVSLDDFQIVNGAQTSHSLLEAFAKSPSALEDVVLMVRVYATSRSDIASRVAVATNSQARIQARELRSNEDVLKKLEAGFLTRGYYFERKKNMHAHQDSRRRIDALKLGQILLAYKLWEPDRAKSDSDQIFGDRFSSIFHENYDVDELCRLVELYRIIDEMRETQTNPPKYVDVKGGELQYLVYGHWFILFAAYLIVSKEKRQIPVGDEAGEVVMKAISLVARACNNVKSTAQYQLFRSSKTKLRIIAEHEGHQLSLFDV